MIKKGATLLSRPLDSFFWFGLDWYSHQSNSSTGLICRKSSALMPPSPTFTTVEVWRHLPCPMEPMENKHVLHSSDAHYLEDIQEPEFSLRLPEKSVAALLDWMRTQK